MSRHLASKKITVILPAANEEASIKDLCRALLDEFTKISHDCSAIFVIDSISKDRTRKILEKEAARDSRIQVVFAPENKNVVDAYLRGYAEALKKGADYIIEMDCGFSHLPSEMHQFIDQLNAGFDVVFGRRPLLSQRYGAPLSRRLISLSGTILSNLLLGTRYSDSTSGFQAFSAKGAKRILRQKIQSTAHFWHTEVRYLVHKAGLRWTEVTITYSFPSASIRQSSITDAWKNLGRLALQRFRK